MAQINRKEYLILIVCVILPAGGYGISFFVFDCFLRGKILLTLIGLLAAVAILGFAIWRGEKRNQSSY